MDSNICFCRILPYNPEDGLMVMMDAAFEQVKGNGVNSQCGIWATKGMIHLFKKCLREVPNRMDMLTDPKIIGPQYDAIPVLQSDFATEKITLIGPRGQINLVPSGMPVEVGVCA